MTTSIAMTATVKINVPSGSPSKIARQSAWRTTPKDDQSMTKNSHRNMATLHQMLDRSPSSAWPKARKAMLVATPART